MRLVSHTDRDFRRQAHGFAATVRGRWVAGSVRYLRLEADSHSSAPTASPTRIRSARAERDAGFLSAEYLALRPDLVERIV